MDSQYFIVSLRYVSEYFTCFLVFGISQNTNIKVKDAVTLFNDYNFKYMWCRLIQKYTTEGIGVRN